MALTASYGGRCPYCAVNYSKGALISKGVKGWGHVACCGSEEQPLEQIGVEVVRVTAVRDGWVAARVRVLGGDSDGLACSASGALPEDAHPGDRLQLTGRWEESAQWGRQFRTRLAVRELRDDNRGAVALLSSIRGIGEARANAITDAAGGSQALVGLVTGLRRDDLAALLVEHGKLDADRAAEAAKDLCAEADKAAALAYLAGLGLGPARCAAAIKRWGAEAKDLVEANPYALMVLEGIGWAIADRVARAQGIQPDDPRRARAAAQFALEAGVAEGHTWSSEEALRGEGDSKDPTSLAAQQTGVSAEALVAGLAVLFVPQVVRSRGGQAWTLDPVATRVLVDDELGLGDPAVRVQPRQLASAERRCAEHLQRLVEGAERQGALEVPAAALEGLDDDQAAAVRAVATHGVLVATGGPGVGKTHTTRRILDVLEYNGLRTECCAPTGKAALRMKELTGRPSRTIHRLIEWNPAEGEFKRSEDEPLQCDAVIVDESSMVDVALASRLLAAVPTGARLVLVGDVDQLPSVMAGAFYRDVIDSGVAEVARLTTIHRQAEDSPIPWVARSVNHGEEPRLDYGDKVRLIATDPESPDATGQAAIEAVFEAAAALDVPVEQVQVLGPMKKGAAGIEQLNRMLQSRLCPTEGKPTVRIGGGKGEDKECKEDGSREKGTTYTVAGIGDRVMQTKNNYDLSVMNGEIGRVVAADPNGIEAEDALEATDNHSVVTSHDARQRKAAAKGEVEKVKRQAVVLVASFPAPENGGCRYVGYTRAECWDLLLGYAITVHKSQGSSWPVVVAIAHRAHARMLERALVYTAITRAEQACWIVGQRSAVAKAARTVAGAARRGTLCERLLGRVKEQVVAAVEE